MSAVKKLNIVNIENGLEELANRNLSPEEYGKELIALFSSSTTLKRLGTNKANSSEFESGLLWREKIHYVPCALGQLNATINAVKKSDKTLKAKVRLVVVNDGSHILVYDRKYDELTDCTIDKIKDEPQLFLPLAGQEGFRREVESEVDIKATGKLAKVYDALIERNPEWLEGDKRHALNHFMTQIIFCLFAEDTGIFPKDIFTKALKNRAGSDGEHATQVITEIFGVLDLDESHRKDIASWLTEFPYVNGGLFSGEALVPVFTSKAYRYLLETAALDWKHINPDILGSSIQAIVDPKMRGNLGMHYTSVPNILKTLEPLFLNELRDELLKARHSKKQINAFLERLSKIVVFDPACGSGNFLVIAYRELRKLELQALDALRDVEGGASLAFGFSSVISLSNFYGIEYADFAAETAKLALWIAEYQQNARFVAAFGHNIPSLPLKDSGKIICANSLRVNWESICQSGENETFLVGNPPYLGSSLMTKEQKQDIRLCFEQFTKSWKTLDYVSGWFLKAAEYCGNKALRRFSFVATNSITQGSQVPILWPLLRKLNMEIAFAHTSFKWSNNAANNAAVICVIIGMRNVSNSRKILISDNGQKEVSNINSYLVAGENIEVESSRAPKNGLQPMDYGNKPADGSNLIMSSGEAEEFCKQYSAESRYVRRFVGSQEAIKGIVRYCIWVEEGETVNALANPVIRKKAEKVREMRLQSTKRQTRELAEQPLRFGEVRQFDSDSVLLIPRHSSENRDYLPIAVLSNNEIVSDSAFAIYKGTLDIFAILVSRIHLLWINTVCGKIKTDFRYSNTLGWHTFPFPHLNDSQREELKESGRKIILAREAYFPKTIAELYDRQSMPSDLKELHTKNDLMIEKFYSHTPFSSDEERLEHLFERYVNMKQGGVQ